MSEREGPIRSDDFPEGEAMAAQINRRHRQGMLWRTAFRLATVLAIVVLLVLLLNVINQSFGLTAVQSKIPTNILIENHFKEQIFAAPNVVAGEDDQELAEGVAADPRATGFFGYAFYEESQDRLKLLAVEGVVPSTETVNDGSYPLTRPLYIYTSREKLQEEAEVAAFVRFYLRNVGQAMDLVGYFPTDAETQSQVRRELAAVLQDAQVSTVAPNEVGGAVVVSGSSTVAPVTNLLGRAFQAEGYSGEVQVRSTGTGGGFDAFCTGDNPEIDIVDASRPVNQLEFETCRSNGRELVEIRVGTDALAVVVNGDNDFVDEVTLPELQQLFAEATTWADVNPEWPAQAVQRFIPTQASGTMDFFIDNVYQSDLAELPKDVLVEMLAANISVGLGRRFEREQRFYEDRLVFEDPQLWAEVCAAEEAPAGCALPARSHENVFRLVQERVVEPTVVEAWYLTDSVLNRDEILAEVANNYGGATVEFRSWLSGEFLTSPQSSVAELAGVRTAILGTLWVIFITMLVAFPLGVGAAIYLEEYADHSKWYNRVIQTNINNLAGVPSIIYGMLGLAVFVRALEVLTSGALFGAVEAGSTANGRTVLSAGLTLALLILPIIIISAQEAIKAVPLSLRQASYGLGATR
ncbi:MAG: substrate-binding domain-containing protein, partial [Candidatus Promineifilaceae bacterium]|nr:substrate-binding domain-containing protein [Candidatus Promineifilaceae bacterium]